MAHWPFKACLPVDGSMLPTETRSLSKQKVHQRHPLEVKSEAQKRVADILTNPSISRSNRLHGGHPHNLEAEGAAKVHDRVMFEVPNHSQSTTLL